MLQITKNISEENYPSFSISISAQLINLSADSELNLDVIRSLIIKQISNTYHISSSNFACNLNIQIENIFKESKINKNKLLFCITEDIVNNNLAQANFKGGIIKINNLHLSLIQSENNRTIPHELGHIFGWDHPHANGIFESVNLGCDPQFEQTLSEKERQNNLMSQSWYIQKTGKSLDEGKEICLSQLELLLNNYTNQKLGNTLHLKGWWIWKKVRIKK